LDIALPALAYLSRVLVTKKKSFLTMTTGQNR
jgi:hypothetical protein